MIQLDKTQTVSQDIIFFLPQALKPLVTQILRQEHIPHTSIFWKNVNTEKYATELAHAKTQYEQAGWSPFQTRYGAIISKIHPNELFRLSKQFFGPTMDMNYHQAKIKTEEKTLSEYEQYHTDLEGQIPITKERR